MEIFSLQVINQTDDGDDNDDDDDDGHFGAQGGL